MLQASDKTDSRQPEYRPLRYDIIALNPTAGDVGYGAISTELGCPGHVRFTPGSDRSAEIRERQFRPTTEVAEPGNAGLALLLASSIGTSAISPGSI